MTPVQCKGQSSPLVAVVTLHLTAPSLTFPLLGCSGGTWSHGSSVRMLPCAGTAEVLHGVEGSPMHGSFQAGIPTRAPE